MRSTEAKSRTPEGRCWKFSNRSLFVIICSMNNTTSSQRVHVSFFGCTNAGKSSLVNAFIGQELSIVSEAKGCTTDPVSKSMELLPLGPCVITDTAGLDDNGDLGQLRVCKTRQILNKTDIGVLTVDSTCGVRNEDILVCRDFMMRQIPFVVALNKWDLNHDRNLFELAREKFPGASAVVCVSSRSGHGIGELKEKIGELGKADDSRGLFDGVVEPGSRVVIVIPVDEAAPKQRIILPQQMAVRSLLDLNCSVVCCQPAGLQRTLDSMKSGPDLVVTDSQAFGEVSRILGEEIPLTSFSILMARFKGFLDVAVNAVGMIEKLEDGDKVLVSEGCSHHRQCGDIGTVKIPRALKKLTEKNVLIETSSGSDFPDDLSEYKMIIHCGGCMITEREVQSRMKLAQAQQIPFTNYGIFLAHASGILERSLLPLK